MNRGPLLLAAGPLAAAGLLAGAVSGMADTAPAPLSPSTLTNTLQGGITTRSTAKSPTSQTSTSGTTPGSLTGSAGSQVVSITPLQTCVSCTSANAGQSSTSGHATALEVFGQTVEGGHSSGNGSQSGALIAVPSNPLITAAILDWAAKSSSTPGDNHSTSRSAVADVALAGGQVATVSVLEAGSSASWTGSSSSANATGKSETNGAEVSLGNGALAIILLHSGADSSGSANAYVASINGNQILSSGQTGGIPIAIPGVATITLLAANASGGTANAAVGTVNGVLGQDGEQAVALGSNGSGGSQQAQSGVRGLSSPPSPSPNANSTPNRNTPTTASTGGVSVPFTGAGLGLAGLLLLGAGGGTLGGSALLRRRRHS